MRQILLTIRPTRYQVGLPPAHTPVHWRYFTDKSLPEEIKSKLGMLMFGFEAPEIGRRCGDKDYLILVSDETFLFLKGWSAHDARVEGQSQSEEGSK